MKRLVFALVLITTLASAAWGQQTTPTQGQEEAQPPAARPQPVYLQPCAWAAAFEARTRYGIVDPTLFSAKTAAVVSAAPEVRGGIGGFMRDFLTGGSSPNAGEAKWSAEAGIKKTHRYTLVKDPGDADLIVYAFMWKPRWGEVHSQVTVVKRGADPCEPEVLYARSGDGGRGSPAPLLYELDGDMKKAEAAKPRAAEIWPKQMQEATKKFERGKYDDAASEARKAMNTAELGFGPKDERVLTSLRMLIAIYAKEGSYGYIDAVPMYKRMVTAAEETLGPQHADLATYLDGYATALRRTGRELEAQAAEGRAAVIRLGTVKLPQ